MTTAYSYIRFSTPEQAGGDSLRRQLDASRSYAKEQGWTLDESFKDLGTSAFKGKHTAVGNLGRFLQAIEDGKIRKGSKLVLESLDRLSRQEVAEALTLFLQIIRKGVDIATLQDRKVYTLDSINKNPFELMYSIGLLSAAHEYSSKLSYRVSQARSQAIQNVREGGKAVPMFKPPYWLRIVDGKYVIDPDRAEIVRTMIKWMLEENVGCHTVAVRATQKKWKTFFNKTFWRDSSVRHLLTNPALYGTYIQAIEGGKKKNADPIPNFYPALITEDQFHELQNCIRARKLNKLVRTGEMVCIFGGTMISGQDGTAMLVRKITNPSGKKHFTLRSQASLVHKSDVGGFAYGPLEKFFLQYVSELQLKKNKPTSELPALQARLDNRLARLAKIKAALVSSDDDVETIMEGMRDLQTEVSELRGQIAELQTEKPTVNPSDFRSLSEQLEQATNKGQIRQQIKVAVSRLLTKAEVYIYHNTKRRVAIIRAIMAATGEARIFAVRSAFRKDTIAAMDIKRYGSKMSFNFEKMGQWCLECNDAEFKNEFSPMDFLLGTDADDGFSIAEKLPTFAGKATKRIKTA